ncbi:MAG: hypothetical protein M3Y91_05075 [Actinomycetota bacterium]|nr:hypothetical protein [Actinomycetota bacterium]
MQPSPFLTLIISLGSPIDVVDMPDRRQAPSSFSAFVGGLHASPATVSYGTCLSCLNVELSPVGAHAVVGVRSGDLASSVVGLDDVMGRQGREVTERLGGVVTWFERFDILDDVFASDLADRAALPGQLVGAWCQLVTFPVARDERRSTVQPADRHTARCSNSRIPPGGRPRT